MLKVTCKLNANVDRSVATITGLEHLSRMSISSSASHGNFYFLLFSITFMILKSGTVVNRLLMEEYCTFLFSNCFLSIMLKNTQDLVEY